MGREGGGGRRRGSRGKVKKKRQEEDIPSPSPRSCNLFKTARRKYIPIIYSKARRSSCRGRGNEGEAKRGGGEGKLRVPSFLSFTLRTTSRGVCTSQERIRVAKMLPCSSLDRLFVWPYSLEKLIVSERA